MSIKIICENRKAFYDYEILEKFEAGLVLVGSEVKSLRSGGGNLGDAYGVISRNEAYLMHFHIAPYKQANLLNHEPLRTRKLLLHLQEINKLIGQTQEKGLTLIPLKLYFKKGRVKVELGLAKSKRKGDKRQSIRKKEADREMERAIRAKRR